MKTTSRQTYSNLSGLPAMLRSIFIISLFVLVGGLSSQAMAASATLEFEAQGLDLDTGAVVDVATGPLAGSTGADIRIAYNADVVPHSVAVPAGAGVEMLYLDNTSFANVTAASVSGLTFTSNATDLPLELNDTVVIRTDTGALFKVGNAVEDGVSVTVSYEKL